MLKVGLSGGIGSGKSTVAAHLASRGAVLVDSDVIAREVVAPGTPGLADIVKDFGERVLAGDGSLDRAALGGIVFADAAARRALEAITHPRIADRTAELFAQAPADAVIVHEVPLLVEKGMGPAYHLVVIVGTPQAVRLRRLVDLRGMDPEQAQSRIDSQAQDSERRAAADVWLDNDSDLGALTRRLDALWDERLVPFEHNLRHGIPSRRPEALMISDPDPTWPDQAERVIGRLRRVLGERVVGIEHIGSTAVAGMPAKDVIDLQVAVNALVDLDDESLQRDLGRSGFLELPGPWWDYVPGAGEDVTAPKRFLAGADPQQFLHIHVREADGAARRRALMFRDWLRAEPSAHAEYAELKRSLVREGLTSTRYAEAKEPWFSQAFVRAQVWAQRSGCAIS